MKTLGFLTLTALLASTPALARPGGPSDEEIASTRDQIFAAADANGDGTLDLAEFTTFGELARAERLERRFQKLDRDDDGLVSSEEMASGEHRRHRRGRR